MGTCPKVTGYKCPWQNGVAERYVLSVRNDMLNHVIIFNEEQLAKKTLSHLQKLQKMQGRIKNYFKHPKIFYAA